MKITRFEFLRSVISVLEQDFEGLIRMYFVTELLQNSAVLCLCMTDTDLLINTVECDAISSDLELWTSAVTMVRLLQSVMYTKLACP